MARYVSLNSGATFRFGAHFWGLAAGTLGLVAISCVPVQADAPMQTTAPAKPAGPVTIPPPLPDTYGQYGKIVAPSDQTAHPLKLKLPLPGFGEVKVPSQDEMNMRDKLEQLALLSDADIRAQLDKWPAYDKMSLRDQGLMLQRIQDFRDYRSNVAKSKAHDMGLLTLLPDQQAKFEKEYWTKRLQLDHDLAKQFAPIYKAREQKLMDELYREYSAVSQGPIVQVPKPAAPPTPPTQPVATPATTAMNPAPAPAMEQAPR